MRSTSSETANRLAEAIDTRTATIGVVGLGYVGLPLAHGFSIVGFPVRGFDVDQKKVDALNSGGQYLDHLAATMFEHLHNDDRFHASADTSGLDDCDVILVAVPTPLGPHQEPDLSFVESTGRRIGETLRQGQLIVLESTTYPGTTREEFATAIAETANDLVLGKDYWIAYSPEREDPGRDMKSTAVPKLVGGLDNTSGALATSVYNAAFDQVITVNSAEIAESAKLLENVFRAVNIALVNEMKTVLDELDIDIWQVIEAAASKPYGFMPFYPGPGLGGHCIPIDPFYLSWKAKEVGRRVQFIELAGVVNQEMPRYVVGRVLTALNDHGKALSNCKVLILGLAYKAGVGDTRESPTYELIELLQQHGAEVHFHDSFAPATIPGRRFRQVLHSADLTEQLLNECDAVIVSTAQPDVDWKLVAKSSNLVIDTRNALAEFATSMGNRLVKA